MNLKKWKCEILLDYDGELPNGFDSVPRSGAMNSISQKLPQASLISCASGWGETITDQDREYYLREKLKELFREFPERKIKRVLDEVLGNYG